MNTQTVKVEDLREGDELASSGHIVESVTEEENPDYVTVTFTDGRTFRSQYCYRKVNIVERA